MSAPNIWQGVNGAYPIPSAIISLAEKANGGSLPVFPQSHEEHLKFIKTPAWRVIEEWGVWRDAQEETVEEV